MAPMTTSPTSEASASNHGSPSRIPGFTLIELLVVIGIIVVLAGILLPVLLHANRSGRLTRLQADLQTISVGLEAYHGDFGDYPRLQPANQAYYAGYTYAPNTGAATLGKALMGPYGDGVNVSGTIVNNDPADPPVDQPIPYSAGDCVTDGAGKYYVCLYEIPGNPAPPLGPPAWAWFNPHDGADGMGFRTQLTMDTNGDGVPDTGAGKVWGPYLQPGAVKMRGCDIVDNEGSPVLYFPLRPGKPNVTAIDTYINGGISPANPASDGAYIDANNNFEIFRHNSGETDRVVLNRIRMSLGDVNLNGAVDTNIGEKAIDAHYILWSAGLDRLSDRPCFGPMNYTPPATTVTGTQVDAVRKIADDHSKFDDVILYK